MFCQYTGAAVLYIQIYWLVRLPLKAGSQYALEQRNIASTSQALRLANGNVSNRDYDSISINRTALVSFIHMDGRSIYYFWG